MPDPLAFLRDLDRLADCPVAVVVAGLLWLVAEFIAALGAILLYA